MTVVYPSYQVLFDLTANTQFELAVFLLLPAIKITMKNILSLAVSHMEDLIPETVIFTIDFFNALYLATCMQRATSVVTVTVIMIVDLAQTAFAMHRLHQHTRSIMTQLQQAQKGNGSLLSAIRTLCWNPRKLKRQVRGGIRVYSCIPHRLTATGTRLLTSLNEPTQRKGTKESSSHLCTTSVLLPRDITSLQTKKCSQTGVTTTAFVVRRITPDAVTRSRPSESQNVLHNTLEVLFTSECLLLAEYLEAIIPLLYGNYMLMMVHLPNTKYHTELSDITRGNVHSTVQTVFVYALLEFLSFATLVVLLQRNCGMRALHQLAFVLETHMPLVQTKLISWVLITLSYRVVHFGMVNFCVSEERTLKMTLISCYCLFFFL